MPELKTIDDLKAAKYNPRKIKAESSAGLSRSLEEYGDISGIVWNSQTGNLVAGHQRVEQLRKQGAVFNDGAIELDGKRWPVRIVDWTLAQEMAANVAANNPHIAGEFTSDLDDILVDIKVSIGDEDFADLRFDALEITLPEIDLGDGEIDAKSGTKRFAVFVLASDKTAKKKLTEVAEAMGGHIAECSHENCNVSVRDLDENAWARRRDKLNPQAAQKRKVVGSESSDSEGS